MLAALMLSACSSKPPIDFSSALQINVDESGVRTIEVTANKNTLSELFKSKSFSFQSFISANCPSELEWDYSESSNSYVVTFRLSFNNLEEYQDKLYALTGRGDGISISRPEVGVKTGFTLSESVEVMELFSWFTDALRERTSMSEAELSPYLHVSSNTLVYGGRTYPQSDNQLSCYVENLLDATRIDILTDVSIDGEWSRAVYIIFPAEMLENASNVRSYLASLIPKSVESSWENSTTWVLNFSADSADSLGGIMNELFQADNSQGLTQQIYAQNSMCLVHSLNETVNFTFFVPNSGDTQVRYFVRDTQGGVISPSDDSDETVPDSDSNYDGYTCIFDRNVHQTDSFKFSSVYQYQPDVLTVETNISSLQQLDRSFMLSFGDVPMAHRALILDALKSDADDFGAVFEEDSGNDFTVIFSQSGTPSWLCKGFEAVFHASEALSFTTDAASLISLRQGFSYSSSLDFSAFLTAPSATRLVYSLTLPRSSHISAESIGSNLSVSGLSNSTLTGESADGTAKLSLSLDIVNPAYAWAIAVLVFASMGVICAMAAVFMKYRHR